MGIEYPKPGENGKTSGLGDLRAENCKKGLKSHLPYTQWGWQSKGRSGRQKAPFKTVWHLITVKSSPCNFNSKFYLGENPSRITARPSVSCEQGGGIHPKQVHTSWEQHWHSEEPTMTAGFLLCQCDPTCMYFTVRKAKVSKLKS